MTPIDSRTDPGGLPSPRHRLSTRIIATSLAALVVVLSMISWTLWLSWQLEAGAAINDTGSLRMRANRVARGADVELMRARRAERSNPAHADETDRMDETIARLAKGNPARPLFIPNDEGIRRQWSEVAGYWREIMKPSALRALGQPDAATTWRRCPSSWPRPTRWCA